MFEKIKALISEKMELDPALIVPTAQFVEDLKLNSLELADLVVLCEEEFGVEIDEDDIHTLLLLIVFVVVIRKVLFLILSSLVLYFEFDYVRFDM